MSNTSTCTKGHFYPATLNSCPFCENATPSPIAGHNDQDDGRTRPVYTGTQPSQSDANTPTTRRVDLPETPAQVEGATILHSAGANTSGAAANRRRLEGWLVSFTLDASGVDFKLYEGKNAIGRDSDCAVRLAHDARVSKHHALIVYRDSQWVFVDELASNASQINGQNVGLGERVILRDGDRIGIGEHEFIFRTVKP